MRHLPAEVAAARPANDVHAATTDLHPEAEVVLDDERLEARLIYETRASAERRLAVAGAENDKLTRRVHAVGELVEEAAGSSRDETLRVVVDLSSMQRTARLRLRRTVWVLALLSLLTLGAWLVIVLHAREAAPNPGAQ